MFSVCLSNLDPLLLKLASWPGNLAHSFAMHQIKNITLAHQSKTLALLSEGKRYIGTMEHTDEVPSDHARRPNPTLSA